jgi:hypothetical protein
MYLAPQSCSITTMCIRRPVLPASAAAPGSVQPPVFKASSNASFTMNLEPLSQQQAEEACNGVCGHLAAYRSAREQNDVEQFYITQVCGSNDARHGIFSAARQTPLSFCQ